MTPLAILLAILGISVLVIVHETGHYLAARAFKMRVIRYSIGFGPALFRYKPKGSPTTFQVCAIPFLAYVQIAGMNPHEDVDPNDPEIYPNKGLFARMITIAAGPFANYVAAMLLVFGLALTAGMPDSETVVPMTVGTVQEGTPAAEAGLKVGDRIVEADGRPVRTVEDLIAITSPRGGQETEYVIERDGRRLDSITIVPKDADGRGVIGVVAESRRTYTQLGFVDALEASVVMPFKVTALQVAGIAMMIRNADSEGLTGPVGMGKIVAEHAENGAPDFVMILVLLSVALGFFNLLPFPALDGGRLVFLVYEMITRKRPNERFEAMVHTVGILFLLGVLVLVTFRDIVG
jgi:regulator of sigma E protease